MYIFVLRYMYVVNFPIRFEFTTVFAIYIGTILPTYSNCSYVVC